LLPLDQLQLLRPGPRDVIEVLLVAFVLYRLLRLISGTRAVQMLVGIVVLVLAYGAASTLRLDMITYLLGLVFRYGALVALIVFQPELRAALAHLGQSRATRFFRTLEREEVADEIAEALDRIARAGTGAIIAIEREMPLGEFVSSGSELHAKVSADLLTTIFTPYSPLHDGAVLLRGDTMIGAGCILPLSQSRLGDRSLGTRHRAAIGLSEETDAIVLVVSEETSVISVAVGGRLTRELTSVQVRDLLIGKTARGAGEPAVLPVAT
jgi:diadenylate cyclase